MIYLIFQILRNILKSFLKKKLFIDSLYRKILFKNIENNTSTNLEIQLRKRKIKNIYNEKITIEQSKIEFN